MRVLWQSKGKKQTVSHKTLSVSGLCTLQIKYYWHLWENLQSIQVWKCFYESDTQPLRGKLCEPSLKTEIWEDSSQYFYWSDPFFQTGEALQEGLTRWNQVWRKQTKGRETCLGESGINMTLVRLLEKDTSTRAAGEMPLQPLWSCRKA